MRILVCFIVVLLLVSYQQTKKEDEYLVEKVMKAIRSVKITSKR